jgi:hypothetical protein
LGIISKPLNELLKNNQFQWNEKAKVAFNQLKRALYTTPMLALPNFHSIFILEIDTCIVGLRAILS